MVGIHGHGLLGVFALVSEVLVEGRVGGSWVLAWRWRLLYDFRGLLLGGRGLENVLLCFAFGRARFAFV